VTVSNLEWEIDQKTGRLQAIKSEIISAGAAQLNAELSLEERVQLGARVQRLLDEQARLKQEIPDLETELAAKSRELDKLTRTVASAPPR
jgi:predicted  nucleic acid-binding Zn-ribbon protein